MRESVDSGSNLPDRRRHGRASVRRPALIHRVSAGGPPLRVSTVDIGPAGAQFLATEALLKGDTIELELSPQDAVAEAAPAPVRGAVVYALPLALGRWSIGMQFFPAASKVRPVTITPPSPSEYKTAIPSTNVAIANRMAAQRHWRRYFVRLLPILLLLVFLGLLHPLLRARDQAKVPNQQQARRQPAVAAVPPQVSNKSNPTGDVETPLPLTAAPGTTRADSVPQRQTELYLANLSWSPPSTTAGSQDIVGDHPVTAARTATDEHTADPPNHVFDATRDLESLAWSPPSTIAGGQDIVGDHPVRAALTATDEHTADRPNDLFDATMDLESLAALGEVATAVGPMVLALPTIEIRTAEFELLVHQGRRLLGVFPVGLGTNGSTPRGDFVVANKIRNPDWYDHGRVVPAGDPQNPLGALWMGLGGPEGATSYGIHPTAALSSIGREASRGCVRMRAGDAEKVFQWCPLGSRVTIR